MSADAGGLRARMEAAVEGLLAALDAMDGDADLELEPPEPDCDREPEGGDMSWAEDVDQTRLRIG